MKWIYSRNTKPNKLFYSSISIRQTKKIALCLTQKEVCFFSVVFQWSPYGDELIATTLAENSNPSYPLILDSIFRLNIAILSFFS